ncbi:hypothetical protein [Robiginitomaculum antarcticum]|uniref:hypothetical protein n=1 Tax=Robiginitomaculum antarcticum TaxID=437507 RepID=UPI0003804A0F|nr:hypothetical protein [Robiginitomaculum antarcticum]
MTAADDILSLAADFIARVTAYLLGLKNIYAPIIIPQPDDIIHSDEMRLIRITAWCGRRKSAQNIYTTPKHAPHLSLGGIPAIRLSGAKRCSRRCLAQRWRVIFCSFLTYARTARGDIILPPVHCAAALVNGHDPPE